MALHEARVLISVIVPVYNVAPYLRRCVDSLLAQTFRNFELILVDDGSSDGSGEICEEYGNIDENENKDEALSGKVNVSVKVIHQSNAGVSAARNRGIEEAHGEYISFVDADDWVEPRFLEAFAEEVEKQGGRVDCVVQGFVNHEGVVQKETYANYPDTKSICSELYQLEKKKLVGYIWNKLFYRPVVIEHNLSFNHTIPIGEDLLFCISFLMQCNSMSVIENAGYHYVFSGHKNYSFRQLDQRLDAFYHLIHEAESIPPDVVDAFLVNEFRFALYILHCLYNERPSHPIRIEYLNKVRHRGKMLKKSKLLQLESPYNWLTIITLFFPPVICDFILRIIFRNQNA